MNVGRCGRGVEFSPAVRYNGERSGRVRFIGMFAPLSRERSINHPMPNRRSSSRFRLGRLSVALSGLCAVAASVAGAEVTPPRVTVRLVLLSAPSPFETTTNLESVGPRVGSQSQLTPGSTVFLEAWCQAPGPNGIVSAIIDLTYETSLFDTTTSQVSLASQWDTLPFAVSVDDSTGFVDDLGGNNLSGLGIAPDWAKIGTIALDVTTTSLDPVGFCSLFSGDPFITFAIEGEGLVPPGEVDYGCLTVGCVTNADCADQHFCTVDSCDPLVGCLRVPDNSRCDDGLFCNGPERCDPATGACPSGPTICPEACCEEVDTCIPTGGCCADSECDDLDACNGSETCVGGACLPGIDVVCTDDGTFCNGPETCDPVTGACPSGPAPCPEVCCEDLDTCIPTGGCCADSDCDDLDACNGSETCVAGACLPGIDVDCTDDGTFCNGPETCDPATGACPSGPAPCPEACCEDLDTCISTGGCCADSDCDDLDACNGSETCVAGACLPGIVVCTDDGNFCNGPETCDPATGACSSGPAPCPEVCCEDLDTCIPNGGICQCSNEPYLVGGSVFPDCSNPLNGVAGVPVCLACDGGYTCITATSGAQGLWSCPDVPCDTCTVTVDGSCAVEDGSCPPLSCTDSVVITVDDDHIPDNQSLAFQFGCIPHDMNGNGFESILGDVPCFVDHVYFNIDQPNPVCAGSVPCACDCNNDGFCSIFGDVPCFVDCVFFDQCCPALPAPSLRSDDLMDTGGIARAGFTVGGAVYANSDDPLSTGVVGVSVELFDASGSSIGSTTTGRLGIWNVDALQAGTYTVVFETFERDGAALRESMVIDVTEENRAAVQSIALHLIEEQSPRDLHRRKAGRNRRR